MSPPPPVLEAEIAGFMAMRRVPGMVAGLVRDGASEAWGFGRVAAGSPSLPDGGTVFEIGSITKVFTATLLARLAADGLVALDQPMRPLLERHVTLPDWRGREVTLLHLVTHTSTLPRASRRMMAKGLRSPANPYRDYQVDDLYADLAQFQPGPDLGRRFEYSNLGFGLLGHLLALRAGRPYEDLVLDEVCRPLGLGDTLITLHEAQRARLAQGHWFGKEVGLWDLPALTGAGALRSTGADLLRFVEANLGLRSTPLQAALRATHDPRVRPSDTLSIGLAWHRSPWGGVPGGSPPPPDVVWHRGETGGMRGFLGFVPERGLGLVLLANASAGVDELGLELMARV